MGADTCDIQPSDALQEVEREIFKNKQDDCEKVVLKP
ncbi:hypothetical protein JOD27_002237 [Lentzea nigeriaca]|nr:hypothetical protein [Lentzea nigeriaca]